MNLQDQAKETLKTAKFEGVDISLFESEGRLQGALTARGSVDLPGDMDKVVANIFSMFKAGKSMTSSDSSEELDG